MVDVRQVPEGDAAIRTTDKHPSSFRTAGNGLHGRIMRQHFLLVGIATFPNIDFAVLTARYKMYSVFAESDAMNFIEMSFLQLLARRHLDGRLKVTAGVSVRLQSGEVLRFDGTFDL